MSVFEHWPNRITAIRFVGSLALFALFTDVLDCTAAEAADPGPVVGGVAVSTSKSVPHPAASTSRTSATAACRPRPHVRTTGPT